MNRIKYYITILLLIITTSISQAQERLKELPLDIFDLPSTLHTVIAEGQGYFPVLDNLGDRMLAVFRDGGGHLGIGGFLVYAWSSGEQLNWDSPGLVVDSQYDDRNPAVALLDSGRIVIGYHEQGSYNDEGKFDTSLKKARAMYTWSDDEGLSWSPAQPIDIPGLESCSPYGRIVSATDGTLLMNVYGPYADQVPGMDKVRDDRGNYSYVIRSTDNGESWGDPSLIADGHNETALLLLTNEHILAAARSTGMQRVDFCVSHDGGYRWSNPLRITDAMQHPADLVRLSNGWILLLYGDRKSEQKSIHGVISRDEGRTWDVNHDILFSRPVVGDFGYPSAVLLPSGKIGLTYYWAGQAENAYDGSEARLYFNLFDEAELIQAYTKMFID